MNTKVISVRVPSAFAKELSAHCKQTNQSISEYVQKGFTKVGMMDLEEIKADASTTEMLTSLGGGSALGILAYKGVKGVMKRKGIQDDQAEILSVISGVACGLLGGYGIHKLIKMMSK